MNAKEIKRLMELSAKTAATLTETEKSELIALQAKQSALETAESGEKQVTTDDLKTIVETAVKAHSATGLSESQVKVIVSEAVKTVPVGLDSKAVTDAVNAAVSAMPKAIDADGIKAAVAEALKATRSKSKMEHADDNSIEIDFPIAHRLGNLPVHQKQLLNIMTDKGLNDGISEELSSKADRLGERAEKALFAQISTKALTAGGAGTGLEVMNFSLSSVLLQRMYLASAVASAFIGQEIVMPTNPYTFPLSTTRPVFQSGVAENAAPTGSQPGTSNLVLNAQKLLGMVNYSYEADEDAVVAILPYVTQQLGSAAGDALEDAIVNGDTTGAQDTGGAAGDALRLFDGIRKLTLAQASLKASLASGGISATNIGALRKLLGRWGLNPKDLLLLVSPNGYNDAVLLPETLTAEKAGGRDAARIFTGVAPSIFGIDIIPSARMRDDLNATGVFDNVTTTKSSILLVHKPSWIQGVRRGFTVEQFVDPRAQARYVIASFRRILKPIEALTNTKAAAIGINY